MKTNHSSSGSAAIKFCRALLPLLASVISYAEPASDTAGSNSMRLSHTVIQHRIQMDVATTSDHYFYLPDQARDEVSFLGVADASPFLGQFGLSAISQGSGASVMLLAQTKFLAAFFPGSAFAQFLARIQTSFEHTEMRSAVYSRGVPEQTLRALNLTELAGVRNAVEFTLPVFDRDLWEGVRHAVKISARYEASSTPQFMVGTDADGHPDYARSYFFSSPDTRSAFLIPEYHIQLRRWWVQPFLDAGWGLGQTAVSGNATNLQDGAAQSRSLSNNTQRVFLRYGLLADWRTLSFMLYGQSANERVFAYRSGDTILAGTTENGYGVALRANW